MRKSFLGSSWSHLFREVSVLSWWTVELAFLYVGKKGGKREFSPFHSMSKLWVKFGGNNAVKVSTEGCADVDDFIKAVKKELQIRNPPQEISISLTAKVKALERDLELNEIPNISENTAKNPLCISVITTAGISNLTVGTAMHIDSTSQKSPFVRSKSDQEFIQNNNLDLQKQSDSLKYLIYHLEKVVDVLKLPNSAKFHDNCLEYRLDQRATTYHPDTIDNVKIVLAVSGAGKTRMLLELLYSSFGYYFTSKSSEKDFGSGDLALCQRYCDDNPQLEKVKGAIKLLYFVRAAVCNYLMENGFKKPWQILLAQLHPVAFFGIDIFEHVLESLLKESFIDTRFENPYRFVAIDEVQILVESLAKFSLPGSKSLRPFFSPLVHFSKTMQVFPQFILSGTGINFEFLKEAMESGTMKRNLVTDYQTISDFHPLSKSEVEKYATRYLKDQKVAQTDEIVSRIASFKLCHGRPRFLAYILDGYMESKDVDFAIGEFVSGISAMDSNIFPLRFFKRDLDNNINTLNRIIGNDTLLRIIRDALLDAIWKGTVKFELTDEAGAAAIRYGLGFGEVTGGLLHSIEIQELAVVECLRYFFPFTYIIKGFAQRIISSPRPQIVGYLMEYLVAFALVSKFSGVEAANIIKSSQALAFQYLRTNDSSQVCFPDHMCGPDIIYKCTKTNTVYIVQVKFVNGMSKQEAANACDTTVPELFYCKRKGNGVLKGFEQKREKLLNELTNLQKAGFSLQKMLFIHSGGNQTSFTQGAFIITKKSDPEFFSAIGSGVWEFLDSVRSNFQ